MTDDQPTRVTALEPIHIVLPMRTVSGGKARLGGALDNFTIRRFMLKPNRDGVYDYVIQRWKE